MVDKFNYTEARRTAKEIIEFFGAAGTFVRPGNTGGYDDDGNSIAATSPVNITGTITPKSDYKASEIDGEVIKTGDAYVYFHSEQDVLVGDTVTLNGLLYRAVGFEELESVDNISVYRKVQLRR